MQTRPIATERRELIARNLGASARYSSEAEAVIEQFQEVMAASADLTPSEQARLLSEMMVQISGQLAKLHSTR